MYSHDQKLSSQFHFQYWSGYFYINPAENGYYSVSASLIYVGDVDDEDASSFSRHFKDLLSKYQENIYSTSVKSYDTWYDKVIAQNIEAPEMVNPQSPMIDMSMFDGNPWVNITIGCVATDRLRESPPPGKRKHNMLVVFDC